MDTLSRYAIHDTVSRLAAQAETQLVSLTQGAPGSRQGAAASRVSDDRRGRRKGHGLPAYFVVLHGAITLPGAPFTSTRSDPAPDPTSPFPEHNSLKAATQELMGNLEDKQNAILQNQEDFRNQLATTADQLGSKLDLSVEQNEHLLEKQKMALENQEHLLTVTSSVNSTLNDVRGVGVGGRGRESCCRGD